MTNQFKAAYVSLYITYLLVAFSIALNASFGYQNPAWFWPATAVCAGAPLTFFLWLMLGKPARTSRHPLGITFISAIAAVVVAVAGWKYPVDVGRLGIWAVLAFAGWWAYIRWYSEFGARTAIALAVGKNLPEFALADTDGQPVSSQDFVGKPHVLLFYRGNWCPLCVAQIKEVAALYQQIADLGAQVVLISPQPATHSRKLAKRFSAPMQFLSDPGNRAARALNINAAAGIPLGLQALGYDTETVMPTVLITDASGRIVYSDLTTNYRIRPEPDEFLRVLRAHAG